MPCLVRLLSITWVSSVLLSSLIGCARQLPPQFSPSEEVRALPDAGADDEEKKLLKQLQEQIEKEVAQQFGTPLKPLLPTDPSADTAQLKRGAEVFSKRCVQCHGVNGDGRGAVAQYLSPLPRDYTKGIFKFTSTPYGSKPRRADLLRTLRAGIGGTSMPTFDDLDPDDLAAVVDYVIYLSQRGEFEQQLAALARDELELPPAAIQESLKTVLSRWEEASSQVVMPLTPMPPMTTETIAKGRDLYFKQVCNKCHGVDGRGGLAGGIDIGKDSWGHNAAAADLTSGMYRGGGRPIDIYRRIFSGINGTPMPGFSQAFSQEPDNIWYLVHFVRDTGERRRRNQPPPPETPQSQPNAAPTGTHSAPPVEPPPEPASEPKAAAAKSRTTLSPTRSS